MDRGAWQANSPWDLERVGHDLVTKQHIDTLHGPTR